MSCVEEAVASAARSLEPEIQSRLRGFLGSIVRAYLPQTWVFRTSDGTASLTIDADGHATVASGLAPSPDVTVELPHDLVKKLLTSRGRESVPPGSVHVTPHTARGRAAFDYLRGRLGL
jgi:hypothetical protein